MKITDFVKPSGNFLKAEDVKKSKTSQFVVISEAEVVDNDYKGKINKRLHVEGDMDTISYILDLSKTNARTISKVLGEDTKTWIGHILTLETYKTKTSEGKMT